MARKSVIEKKVVRTDEGTPTQLTIRVEGHGAVAHVWHDGETFHTEHGPLDPAMVVEAAFHGLSQKFGDAGAIERVIDEKTGAEVNAAPTAKAQAIRAVFERVAQDAEWNARGEGDGTSGVGLLVRAVAEATGIELAAAKDAVSKMDKKVQAAMRGNETIAPIIARMKAEDAAKKPEVQKVDTAALLAGLKKAA